VLLGPATGGASEQILLSGGGASLPAPLYLRWFRAYFRAHPEVRADYQPIGSGAGVTNFLGRRLDFAGSDLPLTEAQLAQVPDGVVQVPVTAGAVAIAYNLPGIEGLRLSRKALAGIFMGRIERWNDPEIAAANPGVTLPEEPIAIVARRDASGTTQALTRHLGAIDPQFAEQVGATLTPVWPKALDERGALIEGRGNDGVSAFVRAIPGALGYVQYGYAALPGQQVAVLENKAGDYVAAGPEGLRAAADSVRSSQDLALLADPPADGAYPLLTPSWLLIHKDYKEPKKLAALKELIRWCVTEGQRDSEPLGYIPIGEQGQQQILKFLDDSLAPAGG
jgi:phosphate transport system substrate-binding protein